MKRFNLLTRQDKTRQDNEISLNFSNDLLLSILYYNDLLLSILYYFQPIFSLHNFFSHTVFNSISIISTINQSILKELKTIVFEGVRNYDNSANIYFLLRELETLAFESKHFLRMFIIKIHFKESSL